MSLKNKIFRFPSFSHIHISQSTFDIVNHEELEILYQDAYIVAINKPNGLLVHRSPMARDTKTFALQEVRNQIGQYVYPVHRLDRKTSGVLVFALSEDAARYLGKAFREGRVHKEYHAIVRGYFPADELRLDYPLTNDNEVLQEAATTFQLITSREIEVPFGNHATSRYSLIRALPETGRIHQIRKHLAHLRHPIIGDRPHGCNKQNKLFKEKWNMDTMMLHAQLLILPHPITQQSISIGAPKPSEFVRMSQLLGF